MRISWSILAMMEVCVCLKWFGFGKIVCKWHSVSIDACLPRVHRVLRCAGLRWKTSTRQGLFGATLLIQRFVGRTGADPTFDERIFFTHLGMILNNLRWVIFIDAEEFFSPGIFCDFRSAIPSVSSSRFVTTARHLSATTGSHGWIATCLVTSNCWGYEVASEDGVEPYKSCCASNMCSSVGEQWCHVQREFHEHVAWEWSRMKVIRELKILGVALQSVKSNCEKTKTLIFRNQELRIVLEILAYVLWVHILRNWWHFPVQSSHQPGKLWWVFKDLYPTNGPLFFSIPRCWPFSMPLPYAASLTGWFPRFRCVHCWWFRNPQANHRLGCIQKPRRK